MEPQMRVGVPRERRPAEHRVALTPNGAAALVAQGVEVRVETDAGERAGFLDGAYRGAGAVIVDSPREVLDVDLVLWVGPPNPEELDLVPHGAAVAGFLDAFTSSDVVRRLADRHLTGLAFEAVPRITTAQSLDALSSQATAAGYAAAILAAEASDKFLPMLTTAAGTIAPAKVLVLGAGVAGLQAIATARRLGAQVTGYDIRPEAAEQIESVGARAIRAVETGPDSGGYAREVTGTEQERQLELLAPHVEAADVVITTAAVPGRRAPVLISHDMVHRMRPGAVIIDLAAASGGNCEVTRADEVSMHGGIVKVLGPTDLPSRVARDASQMYGRNVLALLDRVVVDGELVIDLDDEVVSPTCVTHRGDVRHPLSRDLLGLKETT
jgi:H+-translocating NAD(P) transhydrogenase subunit alpha